MNNQGSIPRTTYFPGFNFGSAPATAFNPAGRTIVLDALVGRMVDPALATDPNVAEVRAELDSLITRLVPAADCAAQRTETIVKATCAGLSGQRRSRWCTEGKGHDHPQGNTPTASPRRADPARRGHKRPVTRRDFISQGFLAGTASIVAPTVFGLFANPRRGAWPTSRPTCRR